MNIGVLASGNGSNLQALIDAAGGGRLPASIRLVLADNPAARALERARAAGIPARFIAPGTTRPRLAPAVEDEYVRALRAAGIELVCLAGFMRIIGDRLLRAFPGRIINIHPSLLPAFPGLAAWQQALDYGVKVTGCTVHFVNRGIDTGPIILQATAPVRDDDTPATLLARIQRREHRLYPLAVRLIAEKRLAVTGRRVIAGGGPKNG